jgi:hypothetical protein
MSVHTRQDLKRLSRFTRQRFSHALMSDTKWRKLFTAVNDSAWQASLVVVKFVGSDNAEPKYMRWPGPNSFWPPSEWIDTVEFGPIELRSIEWLMIPAAVVARRLAELAKPGALQDLAAIESALKRVGQFPLETTPDGLKIIGYR